MYKIQYKDSQDVIINCSELSLINDFLQLFQEDMSILHLRHRLVDIYNFRLRVGKPTDEFKFNIPFDTWKYLNHLKSDFSDLPLFSEVDK